ncbi:hypothetical protein RHGRI_032355 [Rhododendron griersonianum]|uniref:Uncharacterized protein n=1 Tax=Rhododendron griersonianum TaxID=479676 RepID=A0AAV6IEP6_9ERIC|nr:hypothetical protein RHGRI_032355 [Rhododendron griersonianum]
MSWVTSHRRWAGGRRGWFQSRDVLGDVGVDSGREAVGDGFVAKVRQAVEGVGTSGFEQTSVVVLCVHKGYVEAFVVQEFCHI